MEEIGLSKKFFCQLNGKIGRDIEESFGQKNVVGNFKEIKFFYTKYNVGYRGKKIRFSAVVNFP